MKEELDGTLFGASNTCFGCSVDHPFGFRLKFTKESSDTVVAHCVPKAHYQGAPGMMHGGLVTTLADEVGAWALVACLDRFGFTTQLKARFVRPVRVEVDTVITARVLKAGHRLVNLSVEVRQKDVCALFEMTFAVLEKSSAEKMLEAPLPEAWLRFCR